MPGSENSLCADLRPAENGTNIFGASSERNLDWCHKNYSPRFNHLRSFETSSRPQSAKLVEAPPARTNRKPAIALNSILAFE
jgi:hypothetical protein